MASVAGIVAMPGSVAPLSAQPAARTPDGWHAPGGASVLDDLLSVPSQAGGGTRAAPAYSDSGASCAGAARSEPCTPGASAPATPGYRGMPLPGAGGASPSDLSSDATPAARPPVPQGQADYSDAGSTSAESARGWSPSPMSQRTPLPAAVVDDPEPEPVPPSRPARRRLQAITDSADDPPPAAAAAVETTGPMPLQAAPAPAGTPTPTPGPGPVPYVSASPLLGSDYSAPPSRPSRSVPASRGAALDRRTSATQPMGCVTAGAWAARLGMDVSSHGEVEYEPPAEVSPSIADAASSLPPCGGVSPTARLASLPDTGGAAATRAHSASLGTYAVGSTRGAHPDAAPARTSYSSRGSPARSRQSISPQRVGRYACANCARRASTRGASASAGTRGRPSTASRGGTPPPPPHATSGSTPRSRSGARAGTAFGRSLSGGRGGPPFEGNGHDGGQVCMRPECTAMHTDVRQHSHTPTRRRVPEIEAKLDARAGGVEVWDRLATDADLRQRNGEAATRLAAHRKEVAAVAEVHPPNQERAHDRRAANAAWLSRPRKARDPPQPDPATHSFHPVLSEGTRTMVEGSGSRVWEHLHRKTQCESKSCYSPASPKATPRLTRSREHIEELNARLYNDASQREQQHQKDVGERMSAWRFQPKISDRSSCMIASRVDRSEHVHNRLSRNTPARRAVSAHAQRTDGRGRRSSQQLYVVVVGGTSVADCPDPGGRRVRLLRRGDTVSINAATLLHVGRAVWGETADGWCAVVKGDGTQVLVPAPGEADQEHTPSKRATPRPVSQAKAQGPPTSARQQQMRRREELEEQLDALRRMA